MMNDIAVAFEGESPAYRWPLSEIGPDLPADWSAREYLVLEMRASSPQRFELRLHTAAGTWKLRMHPFAGAWTRVAVPLKLFQRPAREGFDLASVHNRSFPGCFINLMGPFGPIDAVEAVGVAMDHPIGAPTLEIRSIRLADEAPQQAVIETRPLVDEFGQWIAADWPGKARTLEELKTAWAREEETLPAAGDARPPDFPYSRFGGWRGAQTRATGFFRVEEVDGRWWLVDPEGCLFFSVGADCMGTWNGTPTEGRDGVFAALPPVELGGRPTQRPGQTDMASFFTWNLQRRFGADWRVRWADLSFRRMDAWGLNTIANWSDPALWDAGQKPYVVMLRGWGMEGAVMGLPDVYAPEFTRRADEAAARQCAPRRDDPCLLGYFLANEPPWPGREAELTDLILAGPASEIRSALESFLAPKDTPERRGAFVHDAFARYLDVINAAVRRHDPNHLNLGLRFGGHAPDAVIRACRGFDVYSMNHYGRTLNHDDVERAHRLTGLPVIIGEFHFGTPGRGLSAGLVQTKDQTERGVAYRRYVEDAASLPAVVGCHWFQWADQPATGRMDGENYNIGLVDVTDRPYPEMVEAMTETHRRLFAVHSGSEPPVQRRAEVW